MRLLRSLLVWLTAAMPTVAAGEHWVPMFPSASDAEREGFVRVINHSGVAGTVSMLARDDQGRGRLVDLSIDADETVHFNSEDLEQGNEDKGLSRGIGPGTGDWNLFMIGRPEGGGELNIEVLAYIRTEDGFLTAMHDVVQRDDVGRYRVATFNPAKNDQQVSLLRLVNPGRPALTVAVTGIDGKGESSPTVRVALSPYGTRTVSAQDLESGGDDLEGRLGPADGKWQLAVEPMYEGASVVSPPEILVMSLMRSPTGHLTNLSTAPANQRADRVRVPLFPAAGDSTGRQGFVRVVNHSNQAGEVRVTAWDDAGVEYDPITLELAASETTHFNSDDLERGNAGKGLSGGVGTGEGDWRLVLTSELDIEVLSYIRAEDGFLTSMHDVAPLGGTRYEVAVFNPGRNDQQVSHLRLVNPGEKEAQVVITGVDRLRRSPGSDIRLAVPAGASRTFAASDLESGSMDFEGALGVGSGKWQLILESSEPVVAMSLLESPTGHLTNLSSAPGRHAFTDEFPDSPLVRIHNGNVLILAATEDLRERTPDLRTYAQSFYEWFTDDFDFLLFLSNLGSYYESSATYAGLYVGVMNDTRGIGRGRYFDSRYGSSGKLRGVIHFPDNQGIMYGPALHELNHAWSNFAVPTTTSNHWGFSSADGQLGGFRRSELADHGDGRFSAGSFSTFASRGNTVPYSPIELYLAGLVAPSAVPSLWVGADGEWLVEDGKRVTTEDGDPMFTAADILEYSIDDLVAEHGARDPDQSAAQRDFRAAVILLINGPYPLLESNVAMLSDQAAWLSHAGNDGHPFHNYHEATGGRGSIELGDLPAFRKQAASLSHVPRSFGEPPPPQFCRVAPGGWGWIHEHGEVPTATTGPR